MVRPMAPIVGTGMEEAAAKDSGQCFFASADGIVKEVSANEIVVGSETLVTAKVISLNLIR